MIGERVTVFGCGNMGSAIARTLARAEYRLAVWNRSPSPLTAFSALGIPSSTDTRVAAQEAGILVLVLSDHAAVRAVLADISDRLLSDKVVLNLTSGSIDDAKATAASAAERGALYLDGSIWVLPSMIGEPSTVIA